MLIFCVRGAIEPRDGDIILHGYIELVEQDLRDEAKAAYGFMIYEVHQNRKHLEKHYQDNKPCKDVIPISVF